MRCCVGKPPLLRLTRGASPCLQKPPAVSGVLHSAWTEVLSQEIVGSSTACILSLDVGRSQLQGINVGDSGFITLRPMSIEQKGSLVPLGDLSANLTVQYRSTQQLHDFNLPFQLGYAPGEDNGKFEVRVCAQAPDVVCVFVSASFCLRLCVFASLCLCLCLCLTTCLCRVPVRACTDAGER